MKSLEKSLVSEIGSFVEREILAAYRAGYRQGVNDYDAVTNWTVPALQRIDDLSYAYIRERNEENNS